MADSKPANAIPTDEEIVGVLTAKGGRTDALSLGNGIIELGYSTQSAQLGMQRAADRGIIRYLQDWTIALPADQRPGERTETFAMIKPDATERGIEGEMLSVIHSAGFRILELRRLRLGRAAASWLYREHEGRDHFAGLVDYTISGEVLLMRLDYLGDNHAAPSFRKLMGATDHTKAETGTLRALFAVGYRENSIHGSDSPEAAAAELQYFFPQVAHTGVAWPCEPSLIDCDAKAVAAIAIRAGSNDAPYQVVDQADGAKPSAEEAAFWSRVSNEATRIASWAVHGLGITSRASRRPDGGDPC